MAQNPRYVPVPGSLVEVSNRTIGSRHLLKPSREARELMAGVLARAARKYPALVVFYVVLSTHYHLHLIVESAEQLADFMQYLDSNLATELGRFYGWRGKLWARRYSSIPVSEEPEAQIARLRNLIANSVKEHLVEKVAHWPGLHAAQEILADRPLEGKWVNRTYLYRQRGRRVDPRKALEIETLELTKLPCWGHLSDEDYRERIAELVAQVEAEARVEREVTGKRVLGRKAILGKHPHHMPPREKRSPIPLFHAASKEVRRRMREAFQAFLDAYRIASERLRDGHLDAVFPEGAFPPAQPFVPAARAGPPAR